MMSALIGLAISVLMFLPVWVVLWVLLGSERQRRDAVELQWRRDLTDQVNAYFADRQRLREGDIDD